MLRRIARKQKPGRRNQAPPAIEERGSGGSAPDVGRQRRSRRAAFSRRSRFTVTGSSRSARSSSISALRSWK
ncbi:hypothetical protein STIB_01760 [Streptomyces sp. IB2014 011-1]|nr:hypothetical protein STIB_01760 [Streptomyces sp. IB2014 011-1]